MYEFLYEDDTTEADMVAGFQQLIDSGDAWRLEGAVGRQAMAFIEAGLCTLGEDACFDYYGNRVPSKHEVEAGTKGSQEYVERMSLDNSLRHRGA